jgi:sulfoxide reductase heme-binding subunit YedZ
MNPTVARPLRPARPRAPARFDALYYGVFAGALAPLVEYAIGAYDGTFVLSSDLSIFLNQCGYIGLVLLVASLACTPLRTLFKWTWPARLRKLLGLLGFFYICLHMLAYTGLDRGFDLGSVVKATLERPFILYGMSAFLLLIPLAVTSTNGMLRRLGGKRWQLLHRLAYVVAALGVLHFYLRIKGRDHREPLAFAGVVVVLLTVRLIQALAKRSTTAH